MALKIKETILGFSIAIILVFFVVFGIKAFYKEPKYDDFCQRGVMIDYVSGEYYYDSYPARIKYPAEAECTNENTQYDKSRKECAEKDQDIIYEYDSSGCQVSKGCTPCNVNYNKARDIYNRNVFIIAGIAGIIAIILGALLNLTSVSSGLFGGGVLTILYGTINYWSELADWARFIILGITLVVLIYLGYKKFAKEKPKKSGKRR